MASRTYHHNKKTGVTYVYSVESYYADIVTSAREFRKDLRTEASFLLIQPGTIPPTCRQGIPNGVQSPLGDLQSEFKGLW